MTRPADPPFFLGAHLIGLQTRYRGIFCNTNTVIVDDFSSHDRFAPFAHMFPNSDDRIPMCHESLEHASSLLKPLKPFLLTRVELAVLNVESYKYVDFFDMLLVLAVYISMLAESRSMQEMIDRDFT